MVIHIYDKMTNRELGLNKMITSLQNTQVKEWKKLHTRKERSKTGLFLIEGFHLIEEAFKSNWIIEQMITREDVIVPDVYDHLPNEIVSRAVFQNISQTETPQGIMAIVKRKKSLDTKGNKILIIDRVQDPGNLGTMIRTADAAGFNTVILGEGTVDLYNDKVIRATQGSLFHLDITEGNLRDEILSLKDNNYKVFATALEDAVNYKEVSLQEKTALILGNEGAGVQKDIIDMADHIVTIPIYGKAESLNVGIAAGILMYHLRG